MSGDPLALEENLHCSRGDPHIDLGAQIAVRHGIIMSADIDVIIEADPADLPFRINIRLDRQRAQRVLLDPFEERRARGLELAHRAIVEIEHQRPDGAVQFSKRRYAGAPESSAGPIARRIRPWPCRAACVDAPPARRC